MLSCFLLSFSATSICSLASEMVKPSSVPMLAFALESFDRQQARDQLNGAELVFQWNESIPEQGYCITDERDELGRVLIEASDARGLMYGCFELEELLLTGVPLADVSGKVSKPYLLKRGLKMNIPLDARTPSYDDSGDAAINNTPEIWSIEFWKAHFDEMAKHRFNTLTLWNPHPFPSMIKLDNYPDVALDDVYVTTLEPSGHENEWGEPGLVTQEVLDHLKRVKKITIDQKIEFWNEVFDYAADRGIDIYFYNWNICPNSVATPVKPFYKTYKINMDEEIPGKYGITHQLDDQETIAYYRESVKTFLLTYPQIKGIGVTAGEHMPLAWNGYNREQWLWETYGEGILDAKQLQPERKVDFVHRVWHSDMEQILKYWGKYPDSFELSFKYAKARLYSQPDLPFWKRHVEETQEYGLKTWWNLRNDDIFVYRWGDPEYVRSFVLNFPHEHTAGIHMGSDGYVWGRVFSSKNKELADQLELEKHWNRFYLWGRMSYDPMLSTERVRRAFCQHFGLDTYHGTSIFEALRIASQGIPLVNTFHWRDWDFMWSVETSSSSPNTKGFHSVFQFMDNKPLEGSEMQSPREFANARDDAKTSPFKVADTLRSLVIDTNQILEEIDIDLNQLSPEVCTMLDDIRALSALSDYYADKIEAATHLALFEKTKKQTHHTRAVSALREAIEHWKVYQRVSEKHYLPQNLARVHRFDWSWLLEENLKDLESLRSLKIE